jgi:hypothetical protein
MEILSKQRKMIWVGLAPIFIVLGMVSPVAAASNAMYLLPASKTVASGDSFIVDVHTSSTDPVNAAQVSLTYPADQLTYVSTSFVGSPFEIQAGSAGGNGSVKIGLGTMTPFTGDKQIATVTLRAATMGTTGTIGFASGTLLLSNGVPLPITPTGTIVSFTGTASTPITKTSPSTPTTNAVNSDTKEAAASPTKTADPLPVAIKNTKQPVNKEPLLTNTKRVQL